MVDFFFTNTLVSIYLQYIIYTQAQFTFFWGVLYIISCLVDSSYMKRY